MSNTRKEHSFVQKEKFEEQNRLRHVILMFIIAAVFVVAVTNLRPLDPPNNSVFVSNENEIVKGSLVRNLAVDIKIIGHDGDLIQVKILNYDKRKKYKLDLGDGKVLKVKSQIINYRYTSNGFYEINLTETKNGRVKELSTNTITITKGA